jgi:hypothetical protein
MSCLRKSGDEAQTVTEIALAALVSYSTDIVNLT